MYLYCIAQELFETLTWSPAPMSFLNALCNVVWLVFNSHQNSTGIEVKTLVSAIISNLLLNYSVTHSLCIIDVAFGFYLTKNNDKASFSGSLWGMKWKIALDINIIRWTLGTVINVLIKLRFLYRMPLCCLGPAWDIHLEWHPKFGHTFYL